MMLRFVILLSVVFAVGCEKQLPPKITRERAIQLACAEFKRAGFDTDRYNLHVEYDPRKEEWITHFKSRSEIPRAGDSHVVWVNEKTGETTFGKGQ